MKKLDLKNKLNQHRVLISIIVFSGLLALMAELRSDPSDKSVPAAEAATLIPPGFVLVPIDVQNPEALDSILGQYGVVDLFSQSTDGRAAAIKVAEKIKILRAPLNPNHFAVLAPENEAPTLVRHPGPFYVVIQNPTMNGTSFVKGKKKLKRIFVENLE
jgi:hypothetical protein